MAPTKSRPLGGWDCGLKQEQHLSWYNDDVQAVKKEGKVLLYGTKFSTFKMGMQVPHRVQSEVSKKDHLQPITSGYQYIRDLCKWKGVEILEGHMMPDHVHLLLSIPPKYCVSSFMGYLKGKSAMMIFEKHGNLKYKFGNRHFWATGYYVSTVGLNEATIKKYIREQEKQDMLEDKLTTKEYNDPFKGAGG